MSILFISHSVGDSNALIATANASLKKNPSLKIIVLAIGKSASKQWDSELLNNPALKSSLSLEKIPETLLNKAETSPLDQTEFESFKTLLDLLLEEKKIEKALIGTPSQNKAGLAFQIAKYLTQKLDNPIFIYNDYLFKEPEHCFYDLFKANTDNKEWVNKVEFLVTLPAANEEIKKHDSNAQVNLVGHPSIDSALLSSSSKESFEKTRIRASLEVKEEDCFLFISGSKNLEEDKFLLASLFNYLKKDPISNVKIGLGLHPGNDNPEKYISEILKLAQQFSPHNKCFKIIVNSEFLIRNKQLCEANNNDMVSSELNGNQLAEIADAVASTPPATLFTTAAVRGKFAYYHQAEKDSFLPKNRFFAGPQELLYFFNRIATKPEQKPMTRTELGLLDEKAEEIISGRLFKTTP